MSKIDIDIEVDSAEVFGTYNRKKVCLRFLCDSDELLDQIGKDAAMKYFDLVEKDEE